MPRATSPEQEHGPSYTSTHSAYSVLISPSPTLCTSILRKSTFSSTAALRWCHVRGRIFGSGKDSPANFDTSTCGNETADLRSAAIRRTPATWSTECEPQHCSLVWRKNAILIPRYSAPTTHSSSSRSEERKHSESQITSDQSKLASRLTLLCTIDPVWNGSRQAPIPSCS